MSSTRLALCDVRGPLGELFERLEGNDGQLWLRAFKRMLRKENPWEGKPLSCTKRLDIATFLGKDWAIWKGPPDGDGLTGPEEVDERSLAVTEIDWAKVQFDSFLKEGETSITGETKFDRAKKDPRLRLADNAFCSLWDDYQTNKAKSVLEWLYQTFGITFVDFPGLTLRDPGGGRRVLCLCRFGGGGWDWSFRWLDGDWGARRFSAVLDPKDLEVAA